MYAKQKFDEGKVLSLFYKKVKSGLFKSDEVQFATVQLNNVIHGDTKNNVVVKVRTEEIFIRNACGSEFCDGDNVVFNRGWDATVIGVRKKDNHVMIQLHDFFDENLNPALGDVDLTYVRHKN